MPRGRTRGYLTGLGSALVLALELKNPFGLVFVLLGLRHEGVVEFRRTDALRVSVSADSFHSNKGYPFMGKMTNLARLLRLGALTTTGGSFKVNLGMVVDVNNPLSDPANFAFKSYLDGKRKRRMTEIANNHFTFLRANGDAVKVFVGEQNSEGFAESSKAAPNATCQPEAAERRFIFNGVSYPYFYHIYNSTWTNERAVEVPIALAELGKLGYDPGAFIEFGNVLKHYFASPHLVVDKYETGIGVVNRDLVDYIPARKYKLAITISTLEHVGFDPPERKNPLTVPTAIKNIMENCIEPGGRMLATVALGHNRWVDDFLRQNEIFDSVSLMKRGNFGPDDCRWNQVREFPTWGEAQYSPYATPPRYVAICRAQVPPKGLSPSLRIGRLH